MTRISIKKKPAYPPAPQLLQKVRSKLCSFCHFCCMLALALLASCSPDDDGACLRSMGELGSEERSLPPFDRLLLEDRLDVEYRYDSLYRVELSYGQNMLDQIRTEVQDGELRIYNSARCRWLRGLSLVPQLRIYAPGFSSLENRCSGSILFGDSLHSSYFSYDEYDANGEVQLLLSVDSCDIRQHTGRVILRARGRSGLTGLYSASVGRIYAGQLISDASSVNHSSFQPMEVHAGIYLFAGIYERGDLCYFGDPETIEPDILGSGSLSACGD